MSYTTIECEASIDIDDYLEDASDEALMEEFFSRKLFKKYKIPLTPIDLIPVFCKNLDIIKSQEVEMFLNRMLK